jgi:DNA-binding CsgD family transcriptional regulator
VLLEHVRGQSPREVCASLGMDEPTRRAHVRAILEKTSADGIEQLARAIRDMARVRALRETPAG